MLRYHAVGHLSPPSPSVSAFPRTVDRQSGIDGGKEGKNSSVIREILNEVIKRLTYLLQPWFNTLLVKFVIALRQFQGGVSSFVLSQANRAIFVC